jgi:hypothetical protein
MWRLWHKLFGWDYIQWKLGLGTHSVRRIRVAPNGFVYFMCLGEIISLAEPGYYKITYLTCPKDKYIK